MDQITGNPKIFMQFVDKLTMPAFVDTISVKAASDVIVDTSPGHALQGQCHHAQVVLCFTRHLVILQLLFMIKHQLDFNGSWEFRSRAKSTKLGIITIRKLDKMWQIRCYSTPTSNILGTNEKFRIF